MVNAGRSVKKYALVPDRIQNCSLFLGLKAAYFIIVCLNGNFVSGVFMYYCAFKSYIEIVKSGTPPTTSK